MLKIVEIVGIFWILIFVKYSFADLGSCGKSARVRGAIIGGTSLSSAQRGYFPWVVALVTRENDYFCGGVLISINAVLTAAHCIHPKRERTQKLPRDVKSLLGVFNLKDPFEVGRFASATEEIRIHPKWNPDTDRYDADIAVIIMNENAPLNKNIQPICLVKPDSNVLLENNGIVVGYGLSSSYTKHAETMPRILSVPIHKNEDCFLHNKELAGISSKNTFCAGTGNGSGVCLGDSGSGLYVQYDGIQYLRGIVSASLITFELTCDVNDFAIYTSVSDYYDWIIGSGNNGHSNDICNGCNIGICDSCSSEDAILFKACNACGFRGRKGIGWIDTCNACDINEEAGPVWIKHCYGCNISNCEGCIKNVKFVGVNVHKIEECYSCELTKCRGCLISEDVDSS